jgi:hypothetical protein
MYLVGAQSATYEFALSNTTRPIFATNACNSLSFFLQMEIVDYICEGKIYGTPWLLYSAVAKTKQLS